MLTGSPSDELAKLKDESRVGQAEFSQPLATAVQLMVVNILRDWGIHPVAVVGHSSGEIAAAYASNALTMREAIICAYIRGWATTKQDRIGAMAAVGLGRDSVQHLLSEGKVVIACENSPSSVTISGDSDEVDRTIEAIKASADDVFVRRLHVDKAYHSRMLDHAHSFIWSPHVRVIRTDNYIRSHERAGCASRENSISYNRQQGTCRTILLHSIAGCSQHGRLPRGKLLAFEHAESCSFQLCSHKTSPRPSARLQHHLIGDWTTLDSSGTYKTNTEAVTSHQLLHTHVDKGLK